MPARTPLPQSPTLNLERQCNGPVCGIDEAGVAPLAGPVVAAAVRLPEGPKPRSLRGLNDSKLLSADERERFFDVVHRTADVGVGVASVEEIDTLNIYHANLLIDMFPEAQFVHVVRDPRGGVASMKRVSFFPDDAVLNALNRHKVMTHGRAHFRRIVPADQRVEIRYEDLVTAPRETLRTLCSFLRLPYEEEMLRFHVDAERFMTPAAASSFNETATRPISEAHAHKWQSLLTNDEIASVEAVCADEMAEFGYERRHPSLSWAGTLNFAVKWCYWHVQRWRHRRDVHFSVVTPMFQRSRNRLRALEQWIKRGIRRTLSRRSV